ncbi:glycosyltransferase [Candidatus Dependentiae bacterium]|nr:glycosyltransferase [Candidatus Dependentiae bacterium]
MSSILTSVIVCTRNRPNDLSNFLNSLEKQISIPNELIIVDSSDVPLENNDQFKNQFNSEHFPSTKLIYKHSQPGLTLQRNIGLSLFHGELVYFFDDDTILEPDYIQKMNDVFIENPNYGGGMGFVKNIVSKKNNFYRMFHKIFLLQRDYASGKFTMSGMPTHTYGLNNFKNVQVLGGCCMAFRSHVFLKHKFDENLKFYASMEDCDFSARVSKDHQLFYNPAAKLMHLQSPTAREKIENSCAMYIHNYSYLFFKNFFKHNPLKIFAYAWSVLGLLLESLIFRDKIHFNGYIKGLKQYYLK